jgi:hypothetical protein
MRITAGEHALELMLDFNDGIKACAGTEEYVALVVGVLVFAKLVEKNFLELYEIDAPGHSKMALQELQAVAESLANSAIEQADQKKKPDLSVN